MVFKTQLELENYLLKKMENAMVKTQERVYEIIHKFVKQYYAEFTPKVYERTYQLYNSLVKTKIEADSKGYKCYVYFDVASLDYTTKYFTNNYYGSYINPFNFKRSPDGSFPNPKGDGKKVFEAAAHGSHGGYIDGTAIWDEPLKILNTEAINTLKQMLISEGIPVK